MGNTWQNGDGMWRLVIDYKDFKDFKDLKDYKEF